MDNPFGRGLLNGWQLSGISTLASGTPIWLGLLGPGRQRTTRRGPTTARRTSSCCTASGNAQSGIAPIYTCDPRLDGSKVGEKVLDINCIGFPAFGENGQVLPPYDLRTPTRQNHDLTLFKNFAMTGEQKLQFRVGFFNIFNQAFATTNLDRNDVDLTLDTCATARWTTCPTASAAPRTACATRPAGSRSPTKTKENFGKINLLRGRRIIEFALKYYF